jgi:hypothetical protein
VKLSSQIHGYAGRFPVVYVGEVEKSRCQITHVGLLSED